MAQYVTKLTGRKTVAENTMAFIFERPEGFSFTPGQHIDVELLKPIAMHTMLLYTMDVSEDDILVEEFSGY